MACLFVWVFIEDRKKNTELLEQNSETLLALKQINNNMAESLKLIGQNQSKIEEKIDRNYETLIKK